MSRKYEIYLTKSQIDKYNNTGQLNLTKNIFKKPNMSLVLSSKKYNDLKNNKIDKIEILNKSGGFLPLVPLIAGTAGVVSAITSVINSVNNKKTNDKLVEQKIRQNNILEKQNKEGKPIQINSIEKEAKNLIGGGLKRKKGGAISQLNKEILVYKPKKTGGNLISDFQKITFK